jgi:hypothetical protein
MRILPSKTIALLLSGWALLIFANSILIRRYPFTPLTFPISVFEGPSLHPSGLPYAALFLVALYLVLRRADRLTLPKAWAAGLLLIVLGNLAQGSFTTAFYEPFTRGGHQYYSDAMGITGWREWIGQFNDIQPQLFVHSRTHPPFAVLIHYLLSLAGGSLFVLAGAFVLLSSLAIPFVGKVMRSTGLDEKESSQLALLFSVVPAFNIYSAVSLDGVVAALSTIFLVGMVRIIKGGIDKAGVLLLAAGILLTNMLTFAGVFLFATAFLLGARQRILAKRNDVLIVLAITLIVSGVCYLLMRSFLGYDHVEAFITASRIQNPHGFRAVANPIEYLMTRAENVTELIVFLSIGVAAVLLHRDYLRQKILDINDDVTSIFLSAVTVLLAMFLSGAYKGGETARTCLFVYPYFVLMLRNVDAPVRRALVVAAGVQTVIMQSVGWYFW